MLKTLFVSLFLVGLAACGGGQSAEPVQAGTTGDVLNQKDIIDTAESAGAFNTLLQALKAADLTATLKGPGPFTVFAPTDEAFEKLPKDQLQALMQDREKLRSILTYHVIAGRVSARDVAGMSSATTIAGPALSIDTSSGVKVNNATVVQPDVMASNGVIHVIDTVLIPGT
jgi:uncharacterized surface protein with fasciclin (FAS1) repeats